MPAEWCPSRVAARSAWPGVTGLHLDAVSVGEDKRTALAQHRSVVLGHVRVGVGQRKRGGAVLVHIEVGGKRFRQLGQSVLDGLPAGLAAGGGPTEGELVERHGGDRDCPALALVVGGAAEPDGVVGDPDSEVGGLMGPALSSGDS